MAAEVMSIRGFEEDVNEFVWMRTERLDSREGSSSCKASEEVQRLMRTLMEMVNGDEQRKAVEALAMLVCQDR